MVAVHPAAGQFEKQRSFAAAAFFPAGFDSQVLPIAGRAMPQGYLQTRPSSGLGFRVLADRRTGENRKPAD